MTKKSVLRHLHLVNTQPPFNNVLQILLPCTREYHPSSTDRVKVSKDLNRILRVLPNRLLFLRNFPEHLVKVGIQSVLRRLHLNNTQSPFNKVLQLLPGLPCSREYHTSPTDRARVKVSKDLNPILRVLSNCLFFPSLRYLPEHLAKVGIQNVLRRLHLNNRPAVRFNKVHQVLLPCTRNHITFQALLHHKVTQCSQEYLNRLCHKRPDYTLVTFLPPTKRLIVILKYIGVPMVLSQAIPFE